MRKLEGGRLLNRVSYCMRKPCKATNIVDEPITVQDTFPFNPESKTAPETARRWAGGWGGEAPYEELTRDNEPFSITITDLHVRSEGGRAYKVVDDEMRRFDLREDQVIEVMKLRGISPGGAVPGEFVWGILGSQVRLVLVGGMLYKSMVRGAEDKRAFEADASAGLHPTENTLVPGHIYRKKDKSIHAFLGKLKRPGSDKVLYAFIAMPIKDPPDKEDFDEEGMLARGYNKEWVEADKQRRELMKRWDTLTWRAKCSYEWKERYAWQRSTVDYFPESIALMSSPKFEADVGELEPEFFTEIKANEKKQHGYVDGFGAPFVEQEFKRAHKEVPGYIASGDVWVCYGDKDRGRRLTAELRKAKDDFSDGLVWL